MDDRTASASNESALVVRLSRLVPVLILTATAIPSQLRPATFIWWRWDTSDIIANVLLYVPLGFALRGWFTAAGVLALAASLSASIELAQLFYANRFSHPSDVAANALGALAGYALAGRLRTSRDLRLSRAVGTALLLLAGIWVCSTRTFAMWVGGFGWFALEGQYPRFWSLLPRQAIRTGIEIHELGALANTAIGALLAASGIIALLQIRHPGIRAAAGAAVGCCVGTIIMPHANVFPIGYATIGVAAGVAMSACFATRT